jgi:hypothetical protein
MGKTITESETSPQHLRMRERKNPSDPRQGCVDYQSRILDQNQVDRRKHRNGHQGKEVHPMTSGRKNGGKKEGDQLDE